MNPKSWAVICGMELFVALVMFPPMSRWSGGCADFTFAIAHQDMPSGIYYDRDFDWPTGEAYWIDVPAWPLHLVLLCCTTWCVFVHHRRHRRPDNSVDLTLSASRPG